MDSGASGAPGAKLVVERALNATSAAGRNWSRNTPSPFVDGLESLCVSLGLGLVLFDSDDASSPNFSLRVRAVDAIISGCPRCAP